VVSAQISRKVKTTIRSVTETIGLPADLLTFDYFFPWYRHKATNIPSELWFAAPGE
jgi:hypothetical protein